MSASNGTSIVQRAAGPSAASTSSVVQVPSSLPSRSAAMNRTPTAGSHATSGSSRGSPTQVTASIVNTYASVVACTTTDGKINPARSISATTDLSDRDSRGMAGTLLASWYREHGG